MDTQTDYWQAFTPEKVKEEAYYWFRYDKDDPPQIVESSIGALWQIGTGVSRSLEFVATNFPDAQIGVERLKPPND